MNQSQAEELLRKEGFTTIYVWQDGPNAFYPDHAHPVLSAHIILEGEMTLTVKGKTQTFKAGERCDVPANTVHSARMGPKGCRYVIGEKE
jgi:quercetin dioxygenase-like cupin family protein